MGAQITGISPPAIEINKGDANAVLGIAPAASETKTFNVNVGDFESTDTCQIIVPVSVSRPGVGTVTVSATLNDGADKSISKALSVSGDSLLYFMLMNGHQYVTDAKQNTGVGISATAITMASVSQIKVTVAVSNDADLSANFFGASATILRP